MSHAEFRVAFPAAQPLEPTDCDGALDLVREYRDSEIEIYRCRDCAHSISLDRATGRVLNDYLNPLWDPVEDLAEHFRAPDVAGPGRVGPGGAVGPGLRRD
jgi:hypothetical protein